MKHPIHAKRKSFAKWAMPSQRTMTLVKSVIELRKFRAFKAKSPTWMNIGQNHRQVGQRFLVN